MSKKKDSTFKKSQLIKSNKYKHQVDLLNVLLEDGKEYSIKQVDTSINKYMKGSVK